MSLTPGICAECGLPLSLPTTIGYHYGCADIAHDREGAKADRMFPFVVMDGNGRELDRFATEGEADEYVYRMHRARIEKR